MFVYKSKFKKAKSIWTYLDMCLNKCLDMCRDMSGHVCHVSAMCLPCLPWVCQVSARCLLCLPCVCHVSAICLPCLPCVCRVCYVSSVSAMCLSELEKPNIIDPKMRSAVYCCNLQNFLVIYWQFSLTHQYPMYYRGLHTNFEVRSIKNPKMTAI